MLQLIKSTSWEQRVWTFNPVNPTFIQNSVLLGIVFFVIKCDSVTS